MIFLVISQGVGVFLGCWVILVFSGSGSKSGRSNPAQVSGCLQNPEKCGAEIGVTLKLSVCKHPEIVRVQHPENHILTSLVVMV